MIPTALTLQVIRDNAGLTDGYPGGKNCYPVTSLFLIIQDRRTSSISHMDMKHCVPAAEQQQAFEGSDGCLMRFNVAFPKKKRQLWGILKYNHDSLLGCVHSCLTTMCHHKQKTKCLTCSQLSDYRDRWFLCDTKTSPTHWVFFFSFLSVARQNLKIFFFDWIPV